MNPDNSEIETETGDVISCYFDDALSAAECSELAVRLRSDPAIALEFARAARVHALLEAAAPPLPAGRAVVLRRRWLGMGAAAALVAAGSLTALKHFSKSPDSSPSPYIVNQDSGDFHIDRKPLPPGVNLRTVRAPAATAPANLDFLLSNFYVHADPDSLPVPAALRLLEKTIAQSNVLSRRELAALRFTAGKPVVPQPQTEGPMKLEYERGEPPLELPGKGGVLGDPDPKDPRVFTTLRAPFTIKEYLNTCGLYREVRQEPGGVIYAAPAAEVHPLDPPAPSALLETRTFNSPHGSAFGRFSINQYTTQDALQHELRLNLGVDIGRQATVTFDPSLFSPVTQWFTVTSTRPKLDRIAQVLAVRSQRRAAQHLLSSMFILCPPDLLPPDFDAATGMMYNREEFQRYIRGIDQATAAEMELGAKLMVNPGTATTVDRIHAIPQTPAPPRSDWLGIQDAFLTTCVGETVQVSGMVDIGLPALTGMIPLEKLLNKRLAGYTAEGARHYQTGYDLWIPSDSTAMFTLDVNTGDNRVLLMCVTAQTIIP